MLYILSNYECKSETRVGCVTWRACVATTSRISFQRLAVFFSRMEVVLHEYKYGPLSKLGASIISKCISIIVAATGFSKRKEKEAR